RLDARGDDSCRPGVGEEARVLFRTPAHGLHPQATSRQEGGHIRDRHLDDLVVTDDGALLPRRNGHDPTRVRPLQRGARMVTETPVSISRIDIRPSQGDIRKAVVLQGAAYYCAQLECAAP